MGSARREQTHDGADRNAHPANARPAPHNCWITRDPLQKIHALEYTSPLSATLEIALPRFASN